MNSTAGVHPPARCRWALIVAGLFTLLGSFAVAAPAHAGYYGGGYYGGGYYGNPCSYRCGYPGYRYYPRYRYGCGGYSCGRSFVYERRYVEREVVERRYGYGGGGYRSCYGYNPCYGRPYGYYPYAGYGRPWGYGYGGIGRRWPTPYIGGGYAEGYEEAPRPLAPVGYGDEY